MRKGIKVLVGAWITLSLAGAGKGMPLPQKMADREKPVEAKVHEPQPVGQQDSFGGSTKGENSVTPLHSVNSLAKRLLEDQKQILWSPADLRVSDAAWLMPLAGVAST